MKIYYFSFDKDGAGWDQGIWFVQYINRMYATRYLVILEINKRYFEIKNLNKNNKMIIDSLFAVSPIDGRYSDKTKKLQEKMQDIKIINQAKIILIQKLNMSEESAHYYIEKQAMDTRLPKSKVAENIIRTYNN